MTTKTTRTVAAAVALVLAAGAATAWAAQPRRESAAERSQRWSELQHRIERLEAVKAVERLQYISGYYQDRMLFKELPTLFTDDGKVQWIHEVWEGKEAINRMWVDYFGATFSNGTFGPVPGRLFELPQWQEIVTVSEDNLSARSRYRTLAKMAYYREKELWIAGVFENEYVKEDGVWKISSMKFCSPWSAGYTEGWQDVRWSANPEWMPAKPAGIAPSRQASAAEECKDRYPDVGTEDFHFQHPVGGS
ncbi:MULTISPECIES: nuclear transport factor 2 family protein [unclassified Luteimonas]